MKEELIRLFPITLYSNLEKYNEVISKGRCRIFYRGANRNGAFITDEFAEQLISTIPYAPVKGIYSEEEQDFTDHGRARNLGRIYGVVPAEPNFAWEKHLDDDGVEREYACVDVLYYTGLYGEAKEISGKPQSMELYRPSIQGDWKFINGKRYFVYTEGCFLGLQALGNDVEPCFEGASFYSLISSMKEFIAEFEKYNSTFQNQGGQNMPKNLFKLSDDQKLCALWELLNTEDEEGNRICAYSITSVYEDYAIAYNYSKSQYERIYYKKDDSTDSVEITDRKPCFILDITEEEKVVLEEFRQKRNCSFTEIANLVATVEELTNENSTLSTKNTELNNDISTLNTEKENLSTQLAEINANYASAQENITVLTQERDSLASYKKTVEDNAKLSVINTYADSLSEEVLSKYKENLDSYTIEDLDMHLTYEQKQSNPNLFSKQNNPGYVPKDEPTSGIESILARYEKK